MEGKVSKLNSASATVIAIRAGLGLAWLRRALAQVSVLAGGAMFCSVQLVDMCDFQPSGWHALACFSRVQYISFQEYHMTSHGHAHAFRGHGHDRGYLTNRIESNRCLSGR